MRVLLVSANKGAALLPVFPLGPAYLAGNLDSRDGVQALDLFLTPDYEQALEQTIASFQPEIIGVSVRNLDAQDFYHPVSLLDDPKAVVSLCRRLSEAPVVIGGPGVGIVPREMLSYLGADVAVPGEGESAFHRLVDGGASRPETPRIAAPVEENLPSLRPPDWRLFGLPEYLARGVTASVQTKRGCPFACVYCSTPLLEGRHVRLRDPEAVVDEMETLAKDFGARMVHFVDNNFNYPPEHAAAICEALIRRGLHLRWICGLHPAYVSAELVGLLKRAGCVFVGVGNESGSAVMLANLGRNFEPGDVELACRLLKEADIVHWAYLLIGGPGETMQTVEESLAQMEALAPTSVHITVGIRIYPDTPLHAIALREGVLTESDNLLFPAFYLSPAIAPAIDDRMKAFCAAHPGWGCNSVPSTPL